MGRKRQQRRLKTVERSPEPYESPQAFLADLQIVLEEDYETELQGEALKEAANNVNAFLRAFL